ncbi:MAG: hypothetical protein AAB900_01640 [Patescibacteria group bacterium]
MAKSKLPIFVQFFIFSLVFLIPSISWATSYFITCDGPQGIESGVPCSLGSLLDKEGLLNHIVDYTIKYLLTPIATIAILYAGIRLVLPNDRPEVKTEMKRLLKTVVLGMVLVFAAYLIVQAVITGLATDQTEPGRAALQIFNSNSSGQ